MIRKDVFFSRIRPYINKSTLTLILQKKEKCIKNHDYRNRNSEKDGLLFSSGRASLKWLLNSLKQQTKKSLRVGLQAFTCHVVPQAIVESRNHVVFFDITPKYFTTLIDDIDFEKIDVLILSHLFGIPNPNYFEICEICKSKNIFIIDDLALTYKSSIQGIEIGTASDAAFYSFGFDKPMSCYQGGLLRINNEELYGELQSNFQKLPQESHKKQINDLLKLWIFYGLFAPNNYSLGGTYEINEHFLSLIDFLRTNPKNVHRIISLSNKVLNKIKRLRYEKSPGNLDPIRVFRMGQLKSFYLNTLASQYADVHRTRLLSANRAKRKIHSKFENVYSPTLAEDIKPSWHRLPLLVPQEKKSEIILWGRKNGIEIGSYNWERLCFEAFQEFNDLKADKFPMSNLAKKMILNLPIWDEKIWDF